MDLLSPNLTKLLNCLVPIRCPQIKTRASVRIGFLPFNQNSRNFGWKANEAKSVKKFWLEIVYYAFSAGPYKSHITGDRIIKGELHRISFGCFADWRKH